KEAYSHFAEPVTKISENTFENSKERFLRDGEQKLGTAFGEVEAKVNTIKSKVSAQTNQDLSSLQSTENKLGQNYHLREESSKEAINSSIGHHFLENATSINLLENATSSMGKQIWHQLFGAADTDSGKGDKQ
ncbi:MAG TPA: hypothetical protein VHA52_06505, partial [Candidatus Babeliaceae bacterium]|nr:hypothetical protein [Candidatus Babeliaceae bacterium]